MKTNVHMLTEDADTLECILDESQRAAEYNSLGKKQSLQLRLLAEELIGMMPELLKFGNGEFWIENDANVYEIHAAVFADRLDLQTRDKLLSVSKTGKNAAAKGIMNKIRIIARKMLDDYAVSLEVFNQTDYSFYDMGAITIPLYSEAWSLKSYRYNTEVQNSKDDWDELEKSIIANIADDVIVGVMGKKVEIVIKKKFDM